MVALFLLGEVTHILFHTDNNRKRKVVYPMFNKKTIILTGIFGVLVFALAINSYSVDSTSWWYNFGKDLEKVNRSIDSSDVVAYVADESVTRADVEYWRLASEYNARLDENLNSISFSEALDKAIEIKLVETEAKHQGLWPSKQETTEYIDWVRRSLEELPEEEKQHFQEYLRGLGMTEKEFFEDNRTINAYASALATSKLMQQANTEAWQDYLLELQSLYDIIILHEK